VLEGRASWDDVRGALAEHRAFLRTFTAERSVQTNEVARCWVLLPAFLLLAEEAGAEVVDAIELGPAAGFNLLWDRYRYRYADGEWGPVSAPLELTGEERRAVPAELLQRRLGVRRSVGIDLSPVDVTDEDAARLLKCFVWADQRARLERLDTVIECVRADPPELLQGDYVELLPELLAHREPGALTLVYQTASMGYLTDAERERVWATLEAAGRDAPLAWVSTTNALDPDLSGFGLDARFWPGERRVVAHGDFHGAWLEWLA
jgi:hypothetical protein